MQLRQIIESHLSQGLTAAAVDRLSLGFDAARRADTMHADRRLAYGVAWAVHGEWERSSLRNSGPAWRAVETLFETICDLQREDGRWNWFVPNQGKLFQHVYGFAMVSLLRTLQEFGDHFRPALRTRIDAMFRKALAVNVAAIEAFVADRKRNVGLNIMTSYLSALWVGGQLLGEKRWSDLAATGMAVVIAYQDESGFWPDDSQHRGPATLYNTVTLTHLAEYAVASKDPAAVRSIEKAANFHRHFVYPDGSLVETIDERNRYHSGTIPALLVAFACFDASRPAAAEYAGLAGERGFAGLSPQEMDLYGTLPDALWIDAFRHTPPESQVTARPDNFVKAFPSIPATIIRAKPWQICLSGSLRAGPARRYHYDLQNHVSIWHDRAGLIIGGGNSLLDPYFSTFRFGGAYLADQSRILQSQDTTTLELNYGLIDASLQCRMIDDRKIELIAQAIGKLPADSVVAFHLPRVMGEAFILDGQESKLTHDAIYLEANLPATVGRLRLQSDRPLKLTWPCFPIDIYDPPKRDEAHAVFRVSVSLHNGPVRLIAEVI